MSALILLLIYRAETRTSLHHLAKALNISTAYVAMMLKGERAIPPAMEVKIRALTAALKTPISLTILRAKLEQRLSRTLSEKELVALIPLVVAHVPLMEDLLADNLGQGDAPSSLHSDLPDFEIATALSGLSSLADILAEEPDLNPEQRVQFQRGIQREAARLKNLLKLRARPAAQPQPQAIARAEVRADRFVDEVFLAQGYYFPDLEIEADLIVRRTQRHGPLGTFALVTRLETDLGRTVIWREGAGMAAAAVRSIATQDPPSPIELDPSLAQAQLRFRLAQFLAAQEAKVLLDRLVMAAHPPDPHCAIQLKRALIAYLAAAMFMPYAPFLAAAQAQRYDIDWLARHFGCSFDQVCHRLIALRKPGQAGVPFGMLRISPAGHTISRITIPGLALPDQRAGCPLWAAYGALQRPGETLTQLAELPDGERFLLIGRTTAGPRAHYGQPRRLTAVMLACDWAYGHALIYADAHDPARQASLTPVGHSCTTCPRDTCESRVGNLISPKF